MKLRSFRAILKMLVGITVAAALQAPANLSAATEPSQAAVQGQTSSTKVKPLAIPLADVATQAAAVADKLDTLSTLGDKDPDVQTVTRQLPQFTTLIDREKPEALKKLREIPTLGTLQELGLIWWKRQQQLTLWLSVLAGRADRLQRALDQIETQRKSWLLTRLGDQATQTLPEVTRQADGVLTELHSTKTTLEQRRRNVLIIQDAVARQLTRCNTVLSSLDKAQEEAMKTLLTQVAPPLWSSELRTQAKSQLRSRISFYVDGFKNDLVTFAGAPPRAFMYQCGLFLTLAVLFAYMRRRVRELAGSGPIPPVLGFVEFPLSAALAGALNFGTSPPLLYPWSIWMLMQVLAAFPMIRMARPFLRRRLVTSLYALALLFLLNTIRHGVAGTPLLDQIMLLTEAVLGMALFRSLLADRSPAQAAPGDTTQRNRRIENMVARLALAALAISIGAATIGFMGLAHLCVSAVFGGVIFTLTLFTFIRIMAGIVGFLLRNWPCCSLLMVRHHRNLLEQRTGTVLLWLALAAALERMLNYVGLLKPAFETVIKVLNLRLEKGTISISCGDVVAFGLAIWLAYLIAAAICFVLNEDVFPRAKVKPGVSYAVSSLLRYVILVIGLLVGFGLLGVTLNRLIILISALGVGIGFGLQGVVNNFISGLILLFECPIRVGDTVEFRTTTGEVRRIGIRSSKVHTLQGAEIIVPNSQLVSESVINWTLSDKLRRIDLPLGVNLGADPRQVITLLQEVAQKNPRILASPACVCYLTGFGDYAINFELWAWTDQFNDWYQIRSDLAVAAHAALKEAGLAFTAPSR